MLYLIYLTKTKSVNTLIIKIANLLKNLKTVMTAVT